MVCWLVMLSLMFMSIPAARDVHVSGEETEEDQGWMDGWCTDTDGGRLGDFNFLGNMLSAKECLAACKEMEAATGCEFLFESICNVHTQKVVSSSGQFFFDHHSFEAKCIAFSVNGVWNSWGSWSSCNAQSGKKKRTRHCNNPETKNRGASCSGSSSDEAKCPVNGAWNSWGSWSSCNAQSGKKKRTRHCNKPTPKNGGATCSGSSRDEANCPGKVGGSPMTWFPIKKNDTHFVLPELHFKVGPGWMNGLCINGKGKDQKNGRKMLGIKRSKGECLNKCRLFKDATGCEFHLGSRRKLKGSGKCLVHTQEVVSSKGKPGYQCFVFPDV